jgi:hypothetical protein
MDRGKGIVKYEGRRWWNTPTQTTRSYQVMPKSLSVRFWEKVNCAGSHQPHMPTCCWEWAGCKNQDGYGRIQLGRHNGNRLESAHRLSLSFVLGRMPPYVMHKCDNPACVRPSHLEEGDHKRNTKDAYLKGRQPRRHKYRGASVYNARYTDTDILTIRELYTKGFTQKEIGKLYGTNQSHISCIIRKKIWAHIV